MSTLVDLGARQLVGGIMLILGFLTRIPALLIAIEMVLTTIIVKVNETQAGLIAPSDQPGVGAEIDVMIGAACLAIALLGAGPISIDAAFGRGRRSRRVAAEESALAA